MQTNKEILDNVENSLQRGDIKSACDNLEAVKVAELINTQSTLYTRFCWRTGQAEAGLRYLNPLLKNKAYRASSGDWAEYAMCLNAVGASAEAREILSEKCSSDPYYNIYMAFSLIYEWDYNAAISLLEKAVTQKDLPSYQLEVARINLLSCYIAEDLTAQAVPLYEMLATSLSPAYQRLHSNLKELHLQLLVVQGRFEEALNCLQQDFKEPPTSGPEVFYYKKWKTIVEVELGLKQIQALIDLRNEAMQSGRWEIARDCEARVAFKTGNPIFLKRIYYSTPWVAYRKRIYSKFMSGIDLGMPFDFWMTPSDKPNFSQPPSIESFHYKVDVEKGEVGSIKIKKGTMAHRLLRALSSDLFRPHPVGALFFRLFDSEKFDLASSPARIYRAVNELREIITASKIPIEIEQLAQGYRLKCHEPVCMILPSDRNANKSLIRLQPLKALGKEEFSAKDTADALEVSLKTAQRILNDVIASGEIQKVGEGASTLYRWSK